jgi:hypothetical protein
MNEKTCTHCKVVKLLSEFPVEKNKPRSKCKSCKSLINKRWRELNKDKITLKNKEKWQKRKNDINYIISYRDYYSNNRNLILENKKEYYEKNKKKILENHKKYEQLQLKNNPLFRLRKNVRRRLHLALNGKFKSKTTLNLIGCSWEELKVYLESKFQSGMSWDNYGYYGWHVDHIIPVSNFNIENLEELKKCMHYTNLQPLWMIDNLKKSNLL